MQMMDQLICRLEEERRVLIYFMLLWRFLNQASTIVEAEASIDVGMNTDRDEKPSM